MKTRDRHRIRKRNVAWLDALLNDGLPRGERITLAMRLLSGMRTGGKSDRSASSAIRQRRLAALAPLARVIHEVLSYVPDGEKNLVPLSRTRLIDELHKWLWVDTDTYETPEGLSVEAIANDHDLWSPTMVRSGKTVKRYKNWTPSRRAFRDLFRGMSIDDILHADPAPAKATPRAR